MRWDKIDWIAEDDQGDDGHPGSQFWQKRAGVVRTKGGQYELHVRSRWGSNQGSLEEHGRVERRYRAPTLDDLLKVGICEVRRDSDLGDCADALCAAIRNVIFEAQDAE
jgi:hypothetical protein